MDAIEAPLPEKTRAGVFLLQTLKKRDAFLAAARAHRSPQPAFLLQARDRRDGVETIRVGYTCSKKVGNAVARNRAKRRLRALAREVLPKKGSQGWDYVLVGRKEETATRPMTALIADLERALTKVHR